MELKKIIHEKIKEIINDETHVILKCTGFTTYHDMTGQRTCELRPYFSHTSLDKFPILLSVVRKEYVAISDNNLSKAIEYKSINHIEDSASTLYVGTLSISEEMVLDGKIELRNDGGTISLKGLDIQFINNY